MDSKQLTNSRIQLHYAIQFMAAAGVALSSPQADGGHSALDWDTELNGFISRTIADTSIQLALLPASLTSVILNDRKPVATLSLAGQTMATALDWHKAELTNLGIVAESMQLLSYPPNDFPDHPLAQGAAFAAGDESERAAIAAYYSVTRPLLKTVIETYPMIASPINIWPHHFDMATLLTLAGSGEEATTIGAGLSPGDGGYDQPYWYITPWPYPPIDALPALAIGTWHTAGWVGALLTASDLGDPTTDATAQSLQAFLTAAIDACRSLVMGDG